jgi:hypothetical protein
MLGRLPRHVTVAQTTGKSYRPEGRRQAGILAGRRRVGP